MVAAASAQLFSRAIKPLDISGLSTVGAAEGYVTIYPLLTGSGARDSLNHRNEIRGLP
ncbi:MAG: hypothetical protein ABSG20_20010 [Bradyrhizobium sp.]